MAGALSDSLIFLFFYILVVICSSIHLYLINTDQTETTLASDFHNETIISNGLLPPLCGLSDQ